MSGVSDIFRLIFTSNADDVIKGNEKLRKSTKETEHDLKNTRDTTQEVGVNFVKMAEAAAGAIGAIGGFEFLKAGVQNAIALNTNLKVVGENLGMTAQQLRTAQEAAKQFGGSAEEGSADARIMAQRNMMMHNKERDPAKMMAQVRAYLMAITDVDNRKLVAQSMGLSESGIRQTTQAGKSEFDAAWQTAAEISAKTNEASDKSYQTNKLGQRVGGEEDSFWNRLETLIAKPLDIFLTKLGNLIGGTGAGLGTGAIIGASTFSLPLLWKFGKKMFSKKAAKTVGKAAPEAAETAEAAEAAEAGAGVAEGAEVVGGLTLAGLAIPTAIAAVTVGAVTYDAYKIKQIIDAYSAMRKRQALAKSFNPPPSSTANSSTDFDIDSNTDEIKKMSAANGYGAPPPLGGKFGKDYDRMAGIKHARGVLEAASSMTPPTRGDISVTIEKIEITTQATDAKGIATGIAGALEEKVYTMLSFVSGQADNGQSR